MSEYPAPSLVVLVGPPGAGKTTWLNNNLPDATRISLEAIRRDPKADRNAIITQAFQDTFAALKTDTIVVFDSTAIQEQVRNRLRGIARYAGAPVYAVIFDEPLDDLIAAQAARKYPVPIARVRELYAEFHAQLATIPAEGWDGVQTVSRATPEETPQKNSMRSRTMITQTRDQLMGGVSPLGAEVEPGSAPDDETLEVGKLPCDWLGQLLGDVFTLYVQAHGYHWNVKGQSFSQFHELFGEVYADVFDSIDPIAEQILALGYDAPGTLTELCAFRELDDPAVIPDSPVLMAASLLASNLVVLDTLQDTYEAADLGEQDGLASFIADRLNAHQKLSWKLRATIDAQPQDLLKPMDAAEDAAEGETPMMEELAGVERAYSPIRVQYRASGAGKQFRVISGYAARFNSLSDDLGGFRELIAPGAFANAIKDADIRLLYNHDSASVLARTGVNLELEEDELGLRMWARVDTNDPDVARVASKLSAGLIDGASFGFTVASDEWDDSGLIPIRTIREIGQCFEVTVCAWPAYPATRVGIMDDAIRSGRLQLGGATHTAPILAGGESRDVVSGMGTISAAAWRARLSYRQHETKRYIK